MKPAEMTSFDVVAYIRRLLNIKKTGHCGTLDPAAVGVLPICLGFATGVTGFMLSMQKAYRVEMVVGIHTNTLDLEGEVIARDDTVRMPEPNRLEEVLKTFIGKQMQLPPMYSAVKVGGKRLYQLAHKGIEIEREPREIEIFSINLIRCIGKRIIFDVECSKGTYIRTLCQDIGKRLDVLLCMSYLIRTKSSGLSIDEALTLEQIERLHQKRELKRCLISADTLLEGYPSVVLTQEQAKKYYNGVPIKLSKAENQSLYYNQLQLKDAVGMAILNGEYLIRVYHNLHFWGLGKLCVQDEEIFLYVKKFLMERE